MRLLKRLDTVIARIERLESQDKLKDERIRWLEQKAGLHCTHRNISYYRDKKGKRIWHCLDCGLENDDTNWSYHIPQ